MLAVNGQTPVAKHGQLKIFNGKVSDQAGNPVVLRGMSMFWSGYPEGAPFYNATTIKWLRDDWCVDVIRATMSVETGTSNYVNNPAAEMAKIKTVIDACIANGMYVIVDFHTHNAENYKTQAKTFFTDIATAYGNQPNVLYETFNEPINQSWSGTIKPYHNELISTIRAKDPDNIIICGTKTYSQDVDEAANDQVTGTNIAYTLHYYANSHQGSLRQKATNALNKGVALFVTEYGTCDASGNGGFNPGESQTWWDYLEANKISSCNWAVDTKSETAAILQPGTGISNWTSSQLTPSGTLVRNYIKGKCNVVVTTGSVTVSFNQTSYNAGQTVTMTATTSVANGTISKVEFYDGTTLLSTKTTSPYTFSTTTLASGGHNITAKSYDGTGAFIASSPLYVISIVGASDVSTTGITDQFESATQFSELTGGINGASCATATAAAAAGIYWFEDRDAATPFKAEATRTGNGKLQYLVSQAANAYNVIGFNFGQYCLAGAKQNYTLDLTQNAVLQLTVSAPATNTATMDLKFQMKDADGTVIAINKAVLLPNGTVDGPNWYKYEIGFSKNHLAPDFLSLAPGSTTNFTFDFKNALSIKNPNAPTFPTDINTNNADFDFSKVVEVVIVPVNKNDTGAPNYQPLAFTDQIINFSGLKMGNPALGVDICTTPIAVKTTDITYCQNATTATSLTATGTAGLTLKWYTAATGGVADLTAPIPSTSVAGVTTYYVSQATNSPNTCEGPRTALKVTIAAPATADAGTNQNITTVTTASLAGTGSAVGTWSLVTGPTGATVTFSPSANAAAVTASGLTADGTYTFKYTVAGTSPCAAVSATVDVVKATPTCTTPPTASAGTNQNITTATTASLTGTGSVVGTWSLVTNPSGVTVTFSPSANAAAVTASGLTADGTYTFKYTVTGTSPCVPATSTVNVVKTTPTCTTAPTASAGTNQNITAATTASLTGTGSAVGTWSLVTNPSGVTVTFSPSANAASVTVSGLTADGTYTFKYTVTGTSPCVPATSTVNVVKSTPTCTTPPTASAGTGQNITSATTTTLTGTGTATGTWSLVTGPTGATVGFSPSANAATVTVNGLTVNGTYTFKYTVTGTSPCTPATSTVNVIKSSPSCTTPPAANAGSAQAITAATTVSLTGTGSATGTWSLVTGPSTVTFSPSANAASVTASGLTANGTYTFKYTVSGVSPCTDATSTVDVVKSAPACTTPPTANAGASQNITTATTASLTGTGSATGKWMLVTGPTGVTVTFSPSANAASVTASGLTANGTYTFKYTVTGTSPCADATSTVDVIKSSPTCITPPTANAGTAQAITSATTVALTGTGSATGTWSLVSGPSTVAFSPSANAASVTANGLTANGTYIFKYTVAGISPCADATSMVEVGKSSPACTTPPTANAGTSQVITTVTAALLTGTGSATGTWSLVSGPSTVTFSPSANAASVTVNGLTATGTYTFNYTVTGASPCTNAVSTVDVVKSTTTAINDAYLKSTIKLYPNPVTDILLIDMDQVTGFKSLKIVDVLGQSLFEKQGSAVVEIDMSDLSKGMYFVQIETESGIVTKSVIKQ